MLLYWVGIDFVPCAHGVYMLWVLRHLAVGSSVHILCFSYMQLEVFGSSVGPVGELFTVLRDSTGLNVAVGAVTSLQPG